MPTYDRTTTFTGAGSLTTVRTITIDIQGHAYGTVAANSLSPTYFTNPVSTIQNLFWGKALYADNPLGFELTSVNNYRDVEVTFWSRFAQVFLRVDANGRGLLLSMNEEASATGGLSITVVENVGETDPPYTGYSEPIPNTWGHLADVPGWNQSDPTGRYYIFGVSGFEIYVIVRTPAGDTELVRQKGWIHTVPGKVRFNVYGGYGFRDISVREIQPVTLYSDIAGKIYDPRDFGLKAVQTTGSMSAGSDQLTVADPTGFAVGDEIIVETSGEAGGGLRGTKGVGGQWPTKTYATEVDMYADLTQPFGTYAWAEDTGRTAWMREEWIPQSMEGLWYQAKAVPKALKATIQSISGSTLTLDETAVVATTNTNVYFNNKTALNYIFSMNGNSVYVLPGTIFNIPSGQYAMDGPLAIVAFNSWTVRGQGRDSTKLFAPRGTQYDGFQIYQCNDFTVHDLEYAGQAGDEYYGNWGSDVWSDWSLQTAFSMGIRGDLCHRLNIHDVRVRDVWQKALGGGFCWNPTITNGEIFNRNAWRRYIGWMCVFSDSDGCIVTDVTIDCPKLYGGFEYFRSSHSKFIRCGGRNILWAFNSTGDFVMDECWVTMEEDIIVAYTDDYGVARYFPKIWQNPIVNVNSNIQPPSPDILLGGLIRNFTCIVEGLPDVPHSSGFNSLIVINGDNPNVSVIGDPPWIGRDTNAVLEGGYFSAPDGVASDNWPEWPTNHGALAVYSWSENTIVDGIRVDGKGFPYWGRGQINTNGANSVVRNSVYTLQADYPGPYPGITAWGINNEQYNNQTWEEWHLRNRIAYYGATGTLTTRATVSLGILKKGVEMIDHRFGPISNLATWEERIELYDTETGDPFSLAPLSNIKVTLRDPLSGIEVLTGDMVDETVRLMDGGVEGAFFWKFTNEQMAALEPKTYEIGVLAEVADEAVQLILGRVSILKGL